MRGMCWRPMVDLAAFAEIDELHGCAPTWVRVHMFRAKACAEQLNSNKAIASRGFRALNPLTVAFCSPVSPVYGETLSPFRLEIDHQLQLRQLLGTGRSPGQLVLPLQPGSRKKK